MSNTDIDRGARVVTILEELAKLRSEHGGAANMTRETLCKGIDLLFELVSFAHADNVSFAYEDQPPQERAVLRADGYGGARPDQVPRAEPSTTLEYRTTTPEGVATNPVSTAASTTPDVKP